MLIVGPGTGIGVVMNLRHKLGDKYETVVMKSEGGHISPGPSNDFDLEAHRFLKKYNNYKENEPVRTEFFCSGIGLKGLYTYIKQSLPSLEEANTILEKKDSFGGKEIFDGAIMEKNEICQKTLNHFIHYLALSCQNYCATVIPTELVIVGGIASYVRNEFINF